MPEIPRKYVALTIDRGSMFALAIADDGTAWKIELSFLPYLDRWGQIPPLPPRMEPDIPVSDLVDLRMCTSSEMTGEVTKWLGTVRQLRALWESYHHCPPELREEMWGSAIDKLFAQVLSE